MNEHHARPEPKSLTWSDIATLPSPVKNETSPAHTRSLLTLRASRRGSSVSSVASFTTSFSCKKTISPTKMAPTPRGGHESALRDMSPNKARYPGLTWPRKTPQTPSHDWDPAYMAAGEAKYAEEVAEIENGGLPTTAGNGLLDALKIHQHKKEAAAKMEEAERARKASSAPMSGLRAAVEAAARDGAARYGPGRFSAASASRVAAFNAGKLITESSGSSDKKRPTNQGKSYTSKPIIPFNHDHSECGSWLTHFEEKYELLYSCALAEGVSTLDLIVAHTIRDGERKNKAPVAPMYSGTGGAYEYELSYTDECEATSSSNDYYTTASETGQSSAPTGTHHQLYHSAEARWSSSMSWVSEEERQRKLFEKMAAQMRHSGMHKSPFVPNTFNEYLEHKAVTLTENHGAIEQQLRGREQDAEQFRGLIMAGKPLPQMPGMVQMSNKLLAIAEGDGLTLTSARPSIWTSECLANGHVDWPTHKEYKSDGDERAKGRYGRFLPLPRIQALDDQYMHLTQGPDALPTYGPGVPREYRKAAGFAKYPKFDGLTETEALELLMPTEELSGGAGDFIRDAEEGDE